ncbi:hypothetical protein MNBD_GAMMA12-1742 [hydrothermal vent metagenome]|uniref:TRASH domain-containing protein n=1 Tax=hydrothermal vent metagenome TaxID=652676 RepID=A0A3B0YAL3_9ZZZZ
MMEGLSGVLFLVVFLYVMMRFGCGSHINHDRDKSSEKNTEPSHMDPVCGSRLSPDEGYGKMHKGHLTRFCSKACLEKFEADPELYFLQEDKL